MLTRLVSFGLALVGAGLFGGSNRAHANAVVTLCGNADQSGSGLNFRNALLKPADPSTLINKITFACPATKTIVAATPVHISQATSIDGNNEITLLANIIVDRVDSFLYLYNMTLQHSFFVPPACANWLAGCSASIINGQGVTELHHVTVQNAIRPIAIKNGRLNVYDSQFVGSSDAVIVAASGTTTLINNSTFKDNLGAAPLKAAGSITVTGSQFINNGASVFDDYYDGQNCSINIDRSTFESNSTNGALNLRCSATISHSTFSANVSSSSGGAISFSGTAASLTVRADKFLNNRSAQDGGAIYWQPQSSAGRVMTIGYSTFTNNSARSGGAVEVAKSTAASGSSTINIGVSTFSRNTAAVTGGALSAADAQLFVARAAFSDNAAGIHGGALSLENLSHTTSVLGNALFARNIAEYGSAFYGANASFINATVDSNLNSGSVAGGAILNSATGGAGRIKFINSIISNNGSVGCKPAGSFQDGGNNLQFPGKDCGSSITIADPHLDTLFIPLPKSPPMGNGNLKVCMAAPINGRDVYGTGRPSAGVCTIGAAESDIHATFTSRHPVQNGQQGQNCHCNQNLLQQLQRLLPFGHVN